MDFQAHAFGCQLQHDLVKNVQWVSTWVSVGNVCRFNRHGHRSGGVSRDCNVQWSEMRGNVKPVITDQLLEQSHSKTDNEIQQNHNTCIPDCMYNPAQKDRVLPKPVQIDFRQRLAKEEFGQARNITMFGSIVPSNVQYSQRGNASIN